MEQKEQKLPKKVGRKPINIELVELERLAGMGLSERQIASALDISNSTLTRKKHIEQIEHALKGGGQKLWPKLAQNFLTMQWRVKKPLLFSFLKTEIQKIGKIAKK